MHGVSMCACVAFLHVSGVSGCVRNEAVRMRHLPAVLHVYYMLVISFAVHVWLHRVNGFQRTSSTMKNIFLLHQPIVAYSQSSFGPFFTVILYLSSNSISHTASCTYGCHLFTNNKNNTQK
ncbi:hypothetical protein CIPAW_16G068100 [Carya illinoinensis]|uniref:Secreted protein n=1 Tax=Carya illinoinensis TaxID=32201 RepID=A0A8T1N7N2_CARIL|nr:hypothetical protein CIPAW_16G068100 [Carya illinoinensis]